MGAALSGTVIRFLRTRALRGQTAVIHPVRDIKQKKVQANPKEIIIKPLPLLLTLMH